MTEQLNDDFYKNEYTKEFVSHWDDLIGWEGREQNEANFFNRLLKAYGAEEVADIACGTGFHSVVLARQGFVVTATDGSANMIDQTRENAVQHNVALADARVVDWLNLDKEFGENRFDALICLGNAFTHLFDHETRRDALEAMFRVLRPGGMLLIDHRNYDDILENGFSSKHKFYYTGDDAHAEPVEINRQLAKFEYSFKNGKKFHLHMYPLKQNYVTFLLEDAGFVDVTRYGDFIRPYDHYDVDFIQQLAFKPHQPAEHTDEERVRSVVRETKDYYDGAANEIYKDIWGENLHLGSFDSPSEDLPTAMQRTNDRMIAKSGIAAKDLVLDVGCGYGALARELARKVGCKVLATNISEKELEWARELTEQAGLGDKVEFGWADFHDLPYETEAFDAYWSQEAFLHAADKHKVLEEAFRVLRPGGRLVFSDVIVRRGTPDEVRQRIYDRIKSPDMWDTPEYRRALKRIGFTIQEDQDWSDNVAPTYAWVRNELERRRAEFEQRIGKDIVDTTSRALQFWVDAARAGQIGWAYFVAEKKKK